LHIQLFDQHLDFKIDALGATWAGYWVLFWNGYWIHLCTQLLYRTCRTVENDGTYFSVEKEGDEFIICGSCSPHKPRFKEAVLEECWIGKLLVAENYGEWMRLFRQNQTRQEIPSRIMVSPEEIAGEAKGVGAQGWLRLRLRRFLGNLGVKDLVFSEQAL
jgi:hypothetical protein